MILDIDHFKGINDTYGHATGDQILKGFAKRVRKVIRIPDVICRIGGEEFVVVMPDTNMEVAARIAERVRAEIEQERFVVPHSGAAVGITVRSAWLSGVMMIFRMAFSAAPTGALSLQIEWPKPRFGGRRLNRFGKPTAKKIRYLGK